MTKAQLLAQMDVSMGGRVAEEIMFGANKVSTGTIFRVLGILKLCIGIVFVL